MVATIHSIILKNYLNEKIPSLVSGIPDYNRRSSISAKNRSHLSQTT